MKNFLYGIGLACVIAWGLLGCEKGDAYPPVPEICFKSMSFEAAGNELDPIDTMVNLTFSFIDGDGDIGMDTAVMPGLSSMIHYTWFYKKADGTYQTYVFATGMTEITKNIPYEEVMNKEEAQNKVLKGTIDVLLERPGRPYSPPDVDTMRIEYFITDRANNQSNTEYTPDFSIRNTAVEAE